MWLYVYYYFMCCSFLFLYVCEWFYVGNDTCGCQKRALGPLKLESQMVVCGHWELWKASLVLLQEQKVVLAAEPFLQLNIAVLAMCFRNKIEIRWLFTCMNTWIKLDLLSFYIDHPYQNFIVLFYHPCHLKNWRLYWHL